LGSDDLRSITLKSYIKLVSDQIRVLRNSLQKSGSLNREHAKSHLGNNSLHLILGKGRVSFHVDHAVPTAVPLFFLYLVKFLLSEGKGCISYAHILLEMW
jgi:hypothetical protein